MRGSVFLFCGVAALVVALGCSGLPSGSGKGSGQGRGSASGGGTPKLKVLTAKSSLKGKGGKRPNSNALQAEHRAGEFIAKLKPGAKGLGGDVGAKTAGQSFNGVLGMVGASQAAMVHAAGTKNPKLSDYLGLNRTIRFKSDKSADQVARELEKGGQVEWVEPVLKVRTVGIPNDPYWQHQWHLQGLKVDQAWEITKGKGAIVAVVDTGVSFSEDGYLHLLPGKDFVDGDDDPQDENGHGTHVAGTIAQKTDNGIGAAGVAPEASILPVRVLDANGSGTNDGVAAGIVWAVDNGANIINLSLGSSQNSEVVADAIAYAYDNDVTVIAATGNDGFTDSIGYPAALPTPIAVGAVDFKHVVTFYSNQGDEIDIVAPGGDTSHDLSGDGQPDGVLQETHESGTWGYMFFQGTSMATPHVAGVAALVYANGARKPDQIREILQNTSKDLGSSGKDTTYGYGLVDPVAALGKPSADTGGALEITHHNVRSLGNGKAVISWTTNLASTTIVKSTTGYKNNNETPVKTHKVTVTGKSGQKASFDIGSTAGGAKARKTVSVTF